MGELFDPSTNFIRVGVVTKSQVFGKLHHNTSISKKCLYSEDKSQDFQLNSHPDDTTTRDHDQNDTNDDCIICYAVLDDIKPFTFVSFKQIPVQIYHNIFIDRFIPDIFQPPKV